MLKRFIVRRESSGKTNGSFRIPIGYFLFGGIDMYERLLSLGDNFIALHIENATNSPKVLMPASYMMKFDTPGDHHEILVQREKLPPYVVELAEKEMCETPSNLSEDAPISILLGDSYQLQLQPSRNLPLEHPITGDEFTPVSLTQEKNDLLANSLVTILNDKVERMSAELDKRAIDLHSASREIDRLRARELKSGRLRLIYEDICYCMVTMVDFHNLTGGTIGGIKAGLSRASWRLDHDTMEGWAEDQAQVREYPEVHAKLAEIKAAWEHDKASASNANDPGYAGGFLGSAVRGVCDRLFSPKKSKTLA